MKVTVEVQDASSTTREPSKPGHSNRGFEKRIKQLLKLNHELRQEKNELRLQLDNMQSVSHQLMMRIPKSEVDEILKAALANIRTTT